MPLISCPHCQKELPDDAKFCGHCGKECQIEVKTEKAEEHKKEDGNYYDLHVFYNQEIAKSPEFREEFKKLAGWNDEKVNGFLAINKSFIVHNRTRKRIKEILEPFQKFNLEHEITNPGEQPTKTKTAPSSSKNNNAWIWIVGISIGIIWLVSTFSQGKSGSSNYSQPTNTHPSSYRGETYIDVVNQFIGALNALDSLDAKATYAEFEEKVSDYKNKLDKLSNTAVPSKFDQGQQVLVNGARLLEEVYSNILLLRQNQNNVDQQTANDLKSKNDSARLLLDQGIKLLKESNKQTS